MATRLYEVLSFVNIGVGAQATLPHHINVNGVAQIPDFLYPDTGGFALVAADATGVTMQNNNAGVASLDLALFFIYSPERLFGQVLSHLTPQPFFVSGGAAAAPGSNLWAPGTGAGSVLQNNGSGNLAGGIDSLAAGESASATREAQFSFASGKFGVAGDAQGGVLVLRGSTPGAAPGEAVELKFGSAADQVIQLEDGKGYTLTITAIAKDTIAGGKGVQSFMQRYSVRRAAGLTVIAAPGASDQFGDVACDTWTLVASVGAAPDRFVLTFTTTGAQAAARCGAKVEIVEVLNA